MRNHMKKALSLMLVLCMTASSLPYMEKTETVHEKSVTSYVESGDVVRGFGNKIKDKKQKKEKFKVNKEDKNGKAWNHQMIQAEVPETSEEVIKVAIIDSGINFNTDLNVVERVNFIPEDECLVLYEDPSGHGTAVAGIIGALDNEEGITGVNPGVELYSARVLDAKLEAPVERIVEAIDWAIEQDVDIINMSFGIEKNVATLEAAVERAAEAGILLVAASGDGEEVAYPAAYDEVIAVGSVTANGTPATNSADGDALELMAPGENILSSGIFGGVMGSSGTSMAAPHVVGAASVLMELNPDMPAEYIRALLNYSANLYGDSDAYGNGVIDLEYAIEINDKFQKLYEKHLKKASKNKEEKEQQKEKFWGEVLKTIPENEKAVETFTEVEVVEGLWSMTTHEDVVSNEWDEVRLTSNQMKILLYACKYPDKSNPDKTEGPLQGMYTNPYHGFLWSGDTSEEITGESNYIANYIYLTRIAANAGKTSGLPTTGMHEKDINRIKADISTEKIGGVKWSEEFAKIGSNIPVTEENKKLFIYGIAMHHVADVFAHSIWADFEWKEKDGIQRIKHFKLKDGSKAPTNCDLTTMFPRRYDMANQVIKNVLSKAYSNSVGTIKDFLPLPSFWMNPKGERFYLGNFQQYALEADPLYYILLGEKNTIEFRSYQYFDLKFNCDTYFWD